jgi:hypothetical protein
MDDLDAKVAAMAAALEAQPQADWAAVPALGRQILRTERLIDDGESS